MIPVTRLNHAVLYVRDARIAADFYQAAFDFEVVEEMPGRAVFLRARNGENHHELGLFSVGADAQPIPPGPRVGLYHLAWEVPTIEALAEARTHLLELGALVGESDHGASKSLYARDPDGNEFEVVWIVPREAWGEYANRGIVQPLDLDAEVARFGSGARR
jgi:catechol-2,3-dioxygenase